MCPESTPNSPLHRSTHTPAVDVLVVRPDLLHHSTHDTLTEPEHDATQERLALLHEELLQIDRDTVAAQAARGPTADAVEIASASDHAQEAFSVSEDSSDDDGVALLHTGALSASGGSPSASAAVLPRVDHLDVSSDDESVVLMQTSAAASSSDAPPRTVVQPEVAPLRPSSQDETLCNPTQSAGSANALNLVTVRGLTDYKPLACPLLRNK